MTWSCSEMKSGRPINFFLLKLLLLVAVSINTGLWDGRTTTAKQGIRDKIKFNFCAQQFNFRIAFFTCLISRKNCFIRFKICWICSLDLKKGDDIERYYGCQRLVETAVKSYCYMLSSLALPCLPNHELVVALRCHRLLFTKKQNDVVV